MVFIKAQEHEKTSPYKGGLIFMQARPWNPGFMKITEWIFRDRRLPGLPSYL